MARSHGTLPALRAAHNDVDDAWPSPRGESRAVVRIDHLEDRLMQQERTTQSLLDRAYKIKEDIIDNLNITHGSWHEEKKARELLQDHIRSITDVVRKLSKDIVYLEDEVRRKDSLTDGANSAVKNLEVHHVAGLTDLRGRVARCDGSISKLSADLKACHDAIRSLNQALQDSNSRVMERVLSMDSKFATVLGRIDKLGAEQEMQIRSVGSDSTHQVSALDSKTRAMIEETRTMLRSHKATEESERTRLEAKVAGLVDKSLAQRDTSIDKLDRKTEEHIMTLHRKMHKLEEELALEKEKNAALQQSMEQKLSQMLTSDLRKQSHDHARLKQECRDGFSTVHESISNMKQVLDGKRKLLEEQLRKEISQIRKMVVLI